MTATICVTAADASCVADCQLPDEVGLCGGGTGRLCNYEQGRQLQRTTAGNSVAYTCSEAEKFSGKGGVTVCGKDGKWSELSGCTAPPETCPSVYTSSVSGEEECDCGAPPKLMNSQMLQQPGTDTGWIDMLDGASETTQGKTFEYRCPKVRAHSYLWSSVDPTLPSPLSCYGALTFEHRCAKGYTVEDEDFPSRSDSTQHTRAKYCHVSRPHSSSRPTD